MRGYLAASVLILMAGGPAGAATLKPAAVDECFVVPETPSTMGWKVESGTLSGATPYLVRDYAEKQVAAGEAKASGAGAIETQFRLPAGFYEIEFPATKQRFGIVALPASRTTDPFFAIDGAISWLVRDEAIREGLVRVARRAGIQMVRERLTWGAVHSAEKQWNWQGPVAFDALRRVYARDGVKVLEMAHDGPAWMGRVGPYPQDLVAAAASWRAIADRWRPGWGALEIWNEPDIFFGGNLPADQYVPLAKAISYGLFGKIDVPLVGGVMAHCNRDFLDTAADNGLLECIDAFSFHTYGRAMEMEGLVAKYREWLQAYDHAAPGRRARKMPLWITECGRPWKKGPERPPAGQDAESALDITMKGVEARACGIARYFAFVYPYYDENDNNFGMMDKRATPLRSFAAYAEMIRALAGKQYLGDLKHDDAAIRRARVFGDEQGAVAVLYTGKADAGATVRLGLPVLHLRGIDGRLLQPASDGAIPVPDGLTYAWLDPKQIGGHVLTNTPAMRLYWLKVMLLRIAPYPIIMRYLFDPAVVEPNPEGYRIKASPAGKMRLAVRVFNLSDEPRFMTLGVKAAAVDEDGVLRQSGPLNVPAKSSADAAWDVDFARPIAKAGRTEVLVHARGRTSPLPGIALPPGPPLVLKFFGETGLMETLQRFHHWVRLPIQELSRWTPNAVGHGKMQIDSTPEAAWRMQVKFGEGDRWVYPFFRLPDGVRLNKGTGLVIRARCRKPAEVRVFLWEGESDVGYITPHSIIPADGRWHVAVIRASDFVPSTANKPDPNGRLDLDQVRRISIGMNSGDAENTLEMSDAYVVSEGP